MQDDRLTLDKAVEEAKSSELVKEQHEMWNADEDGKPEGKLNRIHGKKKRRPKPKIWKEPRGQMSTNIPEILPPKRQCRMHCERQDE